MTLGFVMLAHTALDRAAEVARAAASEGCPVTIHVDRCTDRADYAAFQDAVSNEPLISVTSRYHCEWGTWSLVEASRDAALELLEKNPAINHVMLISGSCLPIKPIADLKSYLAAHLGTDFIESVTIEDVPWAAGGLSEERFLFSFPFAWKRRRRLFDFWVEIQRRLGLKRRIPHGVVPHLGSQWWCLSRETFDQIASDPRRDELERYFRRVWIPDESYFQSIVRLYGRKVESRSLTLSKFDFQGKPHVFYDDHLGLLSDSPAYFARKIWPGAKLLYQTFLGDGPVARPLASGLPGSFADRVFGEAISQRTVGRPGLVMAGRFPREGFENSVTAATYAVLHGFEDVFGGFSSWLGRETGSRAHGRLFAPERAEFADGETMWVGALSDSAKLRDYDPEAFLRNLVWNTRGEHQSFLLSAQDNLKIGSMLARDRNATVFVITGAWIVPLMNSGLDANGLRSRAAELQAKEADFVALLRERRCLANVRIWSLADLIERPSEPLQQIIDDLTGSQTRNLGEMPPFREFSGLPETLQGLRNSGMNPYLTGEVIGLPLPGDAEAEKNVVRLR